MPDDIYDEICRLIEDMEKNDKQITIPNLRKKMADLAAAKELEGYSSPYLKNRVEEDFKRKIVITSVNRNVDVVTFHTTATKVLQDFQNRKASHKTEVGKMRIIKASPDIIKNEIKQLGNNF